MKEEERSIHHIISLPLHAHSPSHHSHNEQVPRRAQGAHAHATRAYSRTATFAAIGALIGRHHIVSAALYLRASADVADQHCNNNATRDTCACRYHIMGDEYTMLPLAIRVTRRAGNKRRAFTAASMLPPRRAGIATASLYCISVPATRHSSPPACLGADAPGTSHLTPAAKSAAWRSQCQPHYRCVSIKRRIGRAATRAYAPHAATHAPRTHTRTARGCAHARARTHHTHPHHTVAHTHTALHMHTPASYGECCVNDLLSSGTVFLPASCISMSSLLPASC